MEAQERDLQEQREAHEAALNRAAESAWHKFWTTLPPALRDQSAPLSGILHMTFVASYIIGRHDELANLVGRVPTNG